MNHICDGGLFTRRRGIARRQFAASTRSRRGFTLVETLVVVFIIVLLAALATQFVLPALATARDAQCQSNVRQIAQATIACAADSGGRLPDCGCSMGGDLTGLLEPYTKQPWGKGIWRCPNAPDFGPTWTSAYGYNWQYLFMPGPAYPHTGWSGFGNGGMRVSQVNRPTMTVMWIDHAPAAGNDNLWSYVTRPADSSNIDGFGRVELRHGGGRSAYAAFVDGHAADIGRDVADPASEPKYWAAR